MLVGGEELKWHQLAHNQLMSQRRSIGRYSPEVRTFGTLIMSTKVFSLIIPKLFDKTILYLEILDYVHRDLMILDLEIIDSIQKI